MDQNFQTSFIPKKPLTEQRPASYSKASSAGPFTLIAIFIFFTILIASGGLYFWKSVLIGNIEKMKVDLKLAQNRFEPGKITAMQVLDKRITASSEILAKHIAISPIFESLQTETIKTIRFTKFNFDYKEGKVNVKMSGQSVGFGPNSGYKGIALQADILSKDKNIIDPIFSNLSLDDKGNVLFDLEFLVDPTFVDYKQMLKTENGNTPAEPVADATVPTGTN